MKVLLVSDEMKISESELETIFSKMVYPLLVTEPSEIAILNANPVELYAIKWAKKLHINYIGFLDNAEAAVDYADIVVYIGSGSNFEDHHVLKRADLKGKRIIGAGVMDEAGYR